MWYGSSSKSDSVWQLAHQSVKLGALAGSQAVVFHPLDITDQGSVEAFAKWAAEELGKVDILVNNAGVPVWSDYMQAVASEPRSLAALPLPSAYRIWLIT